MKPLYFSPELKIWHVKRSKRPYVLLALILLLTNLLTYLGATL